ncbi:MAG: hypothetical protein ACLQA5_21420 [Solirubrobacteraceae bacterium]
MSGTATPEQPNGRAAGSPGEFTSVLVVVTVTDTVAPALIGRDGCSYVSPPQTYEQAVALVRLLLGGAEDLDAKQEWGAPIAGGRRVVKLTEEPGR